MEYYICKIDDGLYHHGTKGMKWGFRRYQNKDGSLTPAGKKRRAKLEKELNKLDGGNKSSGKDDTNENELSVEQKKAKILASHDAKEIYKNKDLFTDKEIQDAYQRLNNENNIKNLIPKKVSRGQKFIDKYVQSAKNTKSLIDSTESFYNSADKAVALLNKIQNRLVSSTNGN